MDFFYQSLQHNQLLWALQNNQTICKSLAYMVTFKNYKKLKVMPKKHSIEIFNDELLISILIYVGYEQNEYLENIKKNECSHSKL